MNSLTVIKKRFQNFEHFDVNFLEGKLMNKKEFITEYRAFLNHYHLKPEQVIVSAGAACMVYGLREEIKDIDVDVEEELFDILNIHHKEKKIEVKEVSGIRIARVISIGNIDIHVLTNDEEFHVIDGIGTYTLNQLLKQKKAMNREKDQADIKAIEHLIKIQKEGN